MGTWQSRLTVSAAARQKVEREQRKLAEVAERKRRAQMAAMREDEQEELRAAARLAKAGPKRVRTTPQRKPKNSLGRKSQHREQEEDGTEGFVSLRLQCPHCDVQPIMDAAVDGGGNVACYDCLLKHAGHLQPVTRLRRCQDSAANSGPDSPYGDEEVAASQTSGWAGRQPHPAASGARAEVAADWGDLSGSGDEHDQSPSTSAMDMMNKLLEAAGAGGGDEHSMHVGDDDEQDDEDDAAGNSNGHHGNGAHGQDDFAAAALLFPGVSQPMGQSVGTAGGTV